MSVRISGKIIASNDTEIPSQGGNSGKFLSTNGSTVSWKNINNGVLTIQKNGSTIDTFSADSATNKTVNITVPTSAADVHALPDTTKYGASVVVSIDNTDYKMTTTLKDQDGNTLGTAQVIDLPLESVVVSGSYDSVNKKIVLTLQNGNTIDIPVADLISGLQTEITPSNKLDADLVDDTTSTHKFVTATDISNWNATALPSQTGHNGEFLTTDGSSTSWAAVDALPAQTGQSGKFLTTDGTDASWATVDALPDQTGQSGKYLTTDGSNASWSGVNADSVKNNNSAVGATNPIYDWIGTSAEFTAQNIATDHPDWLCFITDDSAPTAGIYTAAQCDALFARTADTYSKIESNALLANKANTNADNFTSAGEDYLTGLSFIGEKFEQLVPMNGMSYTAPADGYFCLEGLLTNASGNRLYLLYRPNQTYLYGNKITSMAFGTIATYRRYVWLPVKKGGVVYVTAESTVASPDFNLRFYYANGADYTPPEYTPVEYIEGTLNVQYIKSCIVPNSDMKLYFKAEVTGSGSFTPFGVRNAAYDGAQLNINITTQRITMDWFGGTDVNNRWTLNTAISVNDIFELEVENSVATITQNGTVIGTHTFTPTGAVTREIYLTALNNNGALGSVGTTGRLYEFKLWDDGDLILDMQPAKDSANVACMYNAVMQTLYYNEGTGTYTAGPDINE